MGDLITAAVAEAHAALAYRSQNLKGASLTSLPVPTSWHGNVAA